MYDIIIIGSGPGGYVGAIRCAQLGMKTAIVERYNTLGGTCLNVGCIPSKALLDSSEHFHNAAHTFKEHGIDINTPKVNLGQMINRKNGVVEQTTKGIDFLMKKNKIDVINGHATFTNATTISVSENDGNTNTYQAKHFMIATGSKPIAPSFMNYDKKRVITSTEALNITKLPKNMVVVGGGVIGLELGSVFARLGTEVSVVEYADRIIGGMDKDCSKELQRSLKKLGVKFHLKHKVTDVKGTARSATVTFEPRDGGAAQSIKADYCLIAIGRRPYTENLGLEAAGVKVDDRGRIEINEKLQTSVPHIYAIGDVVKGAMLAHKAEEEGVFVAESLAGQHPHIHYHLIPGVVYTWPEVAGVGHTEEELKAAGRDIKVGKFPMKALGRARASMDTDGMVKVIADSTTDEILGVHIVGARAADMIADAVTLMEFRASAEDVTRKSTAHPTYMEAFKEAALAATANRPIHI